MPSLRFAGYMYTSIYVSGKPRGVLMMWILIVAALSIACGSAVVKGLDR